VLYHTELGRVAVIVMKNRNPKKMVKKLTMLDYNFFVILSYYNTNYCNLCVQILYIPWPIVSQSSLCLPTVMHRDDKHFVV